MCLIISFSSGAFPAHNAGEQGNTTMLLVYTQACTSPVQVTLYLQPQALEHREEHQNMVEN